MVSSARLMTMVLEAFISRTMSLIFSKVNILVESAILCRFSESSSLERAFYFAICYYDKCQLFHRECLLQQDTEPCRLDAKYLKDPDTFSPSDSAFYIDDLEALYFRLYD